MRSPQPSQPANTVFQPTRSAALALGCAGHFESWLQPINPSSESRLRQSRLFETMSVPQPLRDVLRLIAYQLRPTSINWAVTASCSLALQGIPVAVHDIDLRTTAHDAYALEALLRPYQKRPVTFTTTGIVQSHFGVLEINGIDVEIIGDMQHQLADGTWEPIVDMNRFKVWVALDDIELPVMSLPYLYEAYQLLGRTDKVELLKHWFERG
jgi:hypothetical protein